MTVGDDFSVKVWGLSTHQLLSARRLHCAARCVGFSPDGHHLAVGCASGELLVLFSETLRRFLSRRADESPLTALAFSPNGRLLAAGDACGIIRLYLVHGPDDAPERSYRYSACPSAPVSPLLSSHLRIPEPWQGDGVLLQAHRLDKPDRLEL